MKAMMFVPLVAVLGFILVLLATGIALVFNEVAGEFGNSYWRYRVLFFVWRIQLDLIFVASIPRWPWMRFRAKLRFR